MLQNFKQFNGLYGCGFCTHEGQVVEKGKGHARVYPLLGDEMPQRNHNETVELAELATESGVAQMGVKGASPLLLLDEFNVIHGFIPDYMHCVCLGVVKQFTTLWLDTSYSNTPFHIQAADLQKANEFLMSSKPPNDICRLHRSLDERGFWKASEWRAFLLFYSPLIVKQYLPIRYLNHWMLLVFAIHRLVQERVRPADVHDAKLSLLKFVVLLPELYGIEHVSYNVHILTHLADSVKHWGRLWANSAFLYEDNIGKLTKLFSGTQAVSMQI